jgi:hypothetical protein
LVNCEIKKKISTTPPPPPRIAKKMKKIEKYIDSPKCKINSLFKPNTQKQPKSLKNKLSKKPDKESENNP